MYVCTFGQYNLEDTETCVENFIKLSRLPGSPECTIHIHRNTDVTDVLPHGLQKKCFVSLFAITSIFELHLTTIHDDVTSKFLSKYSSFL